MDNKEKFKKIFGTDVVGEIEGFDDRVIVRGASTITHLLRKDIEDLEWIKPIKKYSLAKLPRVKKGDIHYFIYDNNVYNYGAFVRKAIDTFFEKNVGVGMLKINVLNILTFDLPDSYLIVCPILEDVDKLNPEKIIKFEDIFKKISKGFFAV